MGTQKPPPPPPPPTHAFSSLIQSTALVRCHAGDQKETTTFFGALVHPLAVKTQALLYLILSYLCICGVEEFLASVHEEADEKEDDRNYDKCPEPVVLKNVKRLDL
jgi:hypothetical protein